MRPVNIALDQHVRPKRLTSAGHRARDADNPRRRRDGTPPPERRGDTIRCTYPPGPVPRGRVNRRPAFDQQRSDVERQQARSAPAMSSPLGTDGRAAARSSAARDPRPGSWLGCWSVLSPARRRASRAAGLRAESAAADRTRRAPAAGRAPTLAGRQQRIVSQHRSRADRDRIDIRAHALHVAIRLGSGHRRPLARTRRDVAIGARSPPSRSPRGGRAFGP